MQLTGPFRKGRYRPDKGSMARSYQSPRLAGQAFPMLSAQEAGKKGGKRIAGQGKESRTEEAGEHRE